MATTDRRDGKGEFGLTIIAAGTRFTGDVQSDGIVKVEGVMVGALRADRQVLVARGGRVEGDVFSSEAVVGGVIQGSVSAGERVEVQPGAVVNGDIMTNRLIVQEGGEVNGTVQMAEAREEPRGAAAGEATG